MFIIIIIIYYINYIAHFLLYLSKKDVFIELNDRSCTCSNSSTFIALLELDNWKQHWFNNLLHWFFIFTKESIISLLDKYVINEKLVLLTRKFAFGTTNFPYLIKYKMKFIF